MTFARRALPILTALAVSLALAACGGDDDGGDDVPSLEGNADLFTTAGFQEAVDAVEGEEGADAPVLRVQVTSGGAEFQLRDGEQAFGHIYTGGELEPVEVEVIGGGTLEGTDFPLTDVDPAAIDAITEGVRSESGIDDIEITVLTLEKGLTDGVLKWVINAEGGGRTGLVFNADPDGSNVTSPTGDIAGTDDSGGSADAGADAGSGSVGGGGTEVPDAAAIAECVQQAGTDPAALQACTE